MKLIKLLLLCLVSTFFVTGAAGQTANASLNILTLNSGQVNLGGVVDIQVTVGNTGPGNIPANRVRAQISVPAAIVSTLANAQQTGLPPGWTITVNTGSVITICNGSDVIPAGIQRQIFLKVQGNALGGPSTINGSLVFSNGISCTVPGSLPGDGTSDNTATTSIQVIPASACNLGVSASAGTIACNGGTTTLTATPTGANGAVEYSITGGAPFQISNVFTVSAGTYTVTAREVATPACTATASAVTIAQPTAVTASATSTPVTTTGGTNGTATVTAAGGTAPYSYLWTPGGQTTATATGLAAGSYSVTVTDANGCTATATTTVGSPACNVTLTFAQTNVLCFGASTGSATVTAAGTSGAVSYLWSNGQTTATATGLVAGTYSVTVTDGAGCTATGSVTIAQPASAVVAASSATAIFCNGGSSTVTVSATGGTAPYTGTGTFSRTAGTYSFTVTDANGCTATTSVTIGQPTAVTASATSTPVTTTGGTNGTATVTAAGGTAPYSYLWTPGGQTTATATGLAAGSYSVTVTDANGCTATATTTVGSPACNVTLTFAQTNVLCFGASTGSATVTAAGTSGTVTYSWNTTPVQTTATATGLIAGTYNVTVTDGAGCTATGSVTISQPASVVTASATSTPVTTIGGINGTATVTASGGTAPYTYLWTPGGQTTATATGLSAGSYSVTVTDANGCTATAATTVSSPTCNITATAAAGNIACNGGTTILTVTTTGANGAVEYSINGGAFQAANTFVVPAGIYIVIVRQVSSPTCTATTTVVTLTQPTVLIASATSTPVTTIGGINGTATVTASGGTAPYTYLWTPGGQTTATATGLAAGSYTVTVIDANECTTTATTTVGVSGSVCNLSGTASAGTIVCNGGTTTLTVTATGGTGALQYSLNGGIFQSGNTFTVSAGTYTVTVRETANPTCTATTAVTVSQPTALTASATSTPVTTPGGTNGTATVTGAGGTAPYTYLWTSGGQTTATATGLAAGSYSVTVTDANGCTATATTIVGSSSNCNITVTFTTTNVFCFGEKDACIDITATGGIAPYTYAWSNGAIAEDICGLGAGVYSVIVKDATGCTATTLVTITQPTKLVASATATPITIPGGSTTVVITATGGKAPYTGIGSFTRTAGTYNFTVTDANGCSATTTIVLTEPTCNSIVITSTTTNVFCFGEKDACIDITANGGFAPYTYAWSNGATAEDICGLGAGIYNVTVTDAKGCTGTTSVTITQPTKLVASSTAIPITGSECSATVIVTATGGTPPYTGTGSFTRRTGTYNFTVTDANGCSATTTIVLTGPVGCSIDVITATRATNLNSDIYFGSDAKNKNVVEDNIATISSDLKVIVMPNPSNNHFDLIIAGNDKLPITVRIIDMYGRIVSNNQKVSSKSILRVGDGWINGTYMAEITQGDKRKVIKLIKVN